MPKNRAGAPDSAENCIFSEDTTDNMRGEASGEVCEQESIRTQFSDVTEEGEIDE